MNRVILRKRFLDCSETERNRHIIVTDVCNIHFNNDSMVVVCECDDALWIENFSIHEYEIVAVL